MRELEALFDNDVAQPGDFFCRRRCHAKDLGQLGQTWRTLRREADTDNDYVQRNRVFEALQADPAASERLWARMATLRSDGPLNPDWLNRQIDGYLETLGPAPKRDEDAWRTAYRSYESWEGIRSGSGDWNDHEGEVEYLRQWLDDRDAFWAARLP